MGRVCRRMLVGLSLMREVSVRRRRFHIQGFRHLGRRPTVVALEQNPRPGRHAVDVGLGDALLTELVGLVLQRRV